MIEEKKYYQVKRDLFKIEREGRPIHTKEKVC